MIISNYRENRKKIEYRVFKIWDRISIKYSENNRIRFKC